MGLCIQFPLNTLRTEDLLKPHSYFLHKQTFIFYLCLCSSRPLIVWEGCPGAIIIACYLQVWWSWDWSASNMNICTRINNAVTSISEITLRFVEMVPSIWLFDCRLFLVSLTISFQFAYQMLSIGLCCITFWILTLETFL